MVEIMPTAERKEEEKRRKKKSQTFLFAFFPPSHSRSTDVRDPFGRRVRAKKTKPI